MRALFLVCRRLAAFLLYLVHRKDNEEGDGGRERQKERACKSSLVSFYMGIDPIMRPLLISFKLNQLPKAPHPILSLVEVRASTFEFWCDANQSIANLVKESWR